MKITGLKIKRILFLAFFLLLSIQFSISAVVYASEKWPGVDETVIERFAKEFGIESKEPLINTDQGDLLLFVFLLAGAAGGFAAGYYWRALTDSKNNQIEKAHFRSKQS